jgi:hypothetical protein
MQSIAVNPAGIRSSFDIYGSESRYDDEFMDCQLLWRDGNEVLRCQLHVGLGQWTCFKRIDEDGVEKCGVVLE